MKIKIVGRWIGSQPVSCDACLELERLVKLALDELGIKEVGVEQCSSLEEYQAYGLMVSPVLVINGKAKISGKVPPKEMLKEFLKFELEKEKKK